MGHGSTSSASIALMAHLPPSPSHSLNTVSARSRAYPPLFQEVRQFLAALATYRPLVLFLDDLHWSDPASLALLRFLARDVSDAPILLVVAYRTEEVTPEHPFYTLIPILARESSAVRLDLRPLQDEGVRGL